MATEAERALSLSPNLASAHGRKGIALIFSGSPREGIAAERHALRLDPRGPTSAQDLLQIAVGHYFCREYDVTAEIARELIRSYPDFPNPYRQLAASLGQLGRVEEAKTALHTAIAKGPGGFDVFVRSRPVWFRPEDHEHLLEGLRKAGWQN